MAFVWSFGLSGLFGLSGRLVCLVEESEKCEKDGLFGPSGHLVYLVIWSIRNRQGAMGKR